MKLYKIAVIALLASSATSCTKAIIDPGAAPTTPTDTTVVVPPENVKYNDDVKNVMFNNCVTCHGGGAPSAGLDLTTYDAVKGSAQNGTLLQRIENAGSPMPPNGLMSEADRAKVKSWSDNNYPN